MLLIINETKKSYCNFNCSIPLFSFNKNLFNKMREIVSLHVGQCGN